MGAGRRIQPIASRRTLESKIRHAVSRALSGAPRDASLKNGGAGTLWDETALADHSLGSAPSRCFNVNAIHGAVSVFDSVETGRCRARSQVARRHREPATRHHRPAPGPMPGPMDNPPVGPNAPLLGAGQESGGYAAEKNHAGQGPIAARALRRRPSSWNPRLRRPAIMAISGPIGGRRGFGGESVPASIASSAQPAAPRVRPLRDRQSAAWPGSVLVVSTRTNLPCDGQDEPARNNQGDRGTIDPRAPGGSRLAHAN